MLLQHTLHPRRPRAPKGTLLGWAIDAHAALGTQSVLLLRRWLKWKVRLLQGCRIWRRPAAGLSRGAGCSCGRSLAQVQGSLEESTCSAAGCSGCTHRHRCKGQQGMLQRGRAATWAVTRAGLLRSARVLSAEVHCSYAQRSFSAAVSGTAAGSLAAGTPSLHRGF